MALALLCSEWEEVGHARLNHQEITEENLLILQYLNDRSYCPVLPGQILLKESASGLLVIHG